MDHEENNSPVENSMSSEDLKREKSNVETANVLNNAVSIFLEFEGHKYSGNIEELRIGEYLVFNVQAPDDGLVNLPIGFAEIYMRIMTFEKKVRSFKTALLKRKLPRLLLKFPEEEVPVVARKHERLFMNLDTPLIVTLKDTDIGKQEKTGMGFITNVSEGGVSISSKLAIEKGEKVTFFLNTSHGKSKKSMELAGVVRRIDDLQNGLKNYGLQFISISEEAKKEIMAFLTRHPSKISEDT